MNHKTFAVLALVLFAIGATAGCSREPAQRGGAAQASGDLQIDFRSNPDPPVTGANSFEVDVRGADGTPVTDATVTAEFYMAAMPEMKMPEMRNSTTLTHEGGGTYRGEGQVMMAGPWDVTVAVTRGGETIGSRKMAVTAR